jgi:hypothetical protein
MDFLGEYVAQHNFSAYFCIEFFMVLDFKLKINCRDDN